MSEENDILSENKKDEKLPIRRTGSEVISNETCIQIPDDYDYKSWDPMNRDTFYRWMDHLEERRVILDFFGQSLKEIESRWGWRIIVISSFVSFISLIEFNVIPFFSSAEWIFIKKILLSFFSILTTLIAAWIKKGNYVDRIKNIDRRVMEIEHISYELSYQTEIQPCLRKDFKELQKKYEEPINQLRTVSRFISQKERFRTLYKITKYYPDLVRKISPWWKRSKRWGGAMVPDYHYGNAIIKNYEKHKYKAGYGSKIIDCFWCKSKCCETKKGKNPFEDYQYASDLGYGKNQSKYANNNETRKKQKVKSKKNTENNKSKSTDSNGETKKEVVEDNNTNTNKSDSVNSKNKEQIQKKKTNI